MSIQSLDAWLNDQQLDFVRFIKQKQYAEVVRDTGIEYDYVIRYVIPDFYDVTSDPAERIRIYASILGYAQAPVAFIGFSTGMTLLFVSFTDALTFKLKNS
jgi:hypothetical protein